jgi:predicted signal transduction protein with EAL and GGDEF domain
VAALTESALTEAGIDPSRLVFEVTETSAIANIEEAKAFARRLHARGCQLALDDFGAGFGSFYYLKNLPFDYFKIDGDFIRGIAASHTDQLVVEAIVGIARGLGKKTIAEFVTDEETARLVGKAAATARARGTGVSRLAAARRDGEGDSADPPRGSLTVASASVIGFAAGVHPALRASRLTPVDAIRAA